ncbi:unnamed protein product [Calypogeia fissa]
MGAIVQVKFVPGRLHHRQEVKNVGSVNRHFHCSGFRNASFIHVLTTSQRKQSAESRRFENRAWDHYFVIVNTQAKTPRAEESSQRVRTGKGSLKVGGDLAADHGSPRSSTYKGAHRSPKDAMEHRSDSDEEERQATRGSSVSWARLAGADSPLHADEEQSLSADVQDMLSLESQKKDLEKILGREPTVDEWAAHCKTSIFKLYARIGKGRAAKRKMIASSLPLVNSVAQQFRGRGLSHWELCQEGVQGLERSAEKYNTSYNTKFSSYSFLWIWERMSAGVKKFRNVLRISRTVYEKAAIILRTKEEFQVLHGRPPSLEELAELSRMDADKIRNVARLVRPVKSMDEAVSTLDYYEIQVEDQSVGRVPWAHIMESELKAEVAKALQCLTSREKLVLEMRYGLSGEPPKGRAEVGQALDLTYESIRLIEKKALNKLRELATEEGLQQYLSGSVWVQ